MDKREAISLAQQYVYMIGKKYDISKALVFGSYVKGSNRTDSDIDVALVLKNIDNLFDTQIDLLQLRQDKDLIIEPHPFRENDFTIDDPFVHEIVRSGVELTIE